MKQRTTTPAILGIDAGFAACGAALLGIREDGEHQVTWCDSIKTRPEAKKRNVYQADDDARRIAEITDWIVTIIGDHRPQLVAVELPTGGSKSSRAARSMGMATGLVVATLTFLEVGYLVVTPDQVKQAVTGKRQASKQQVMDAARLRWPIAPWSDTKWVLEHSADAAFAALVGANAPLAKALLW